MNSQELENKKKKKKQNQKF